MSKVRIADLKAHLSHHLRKVRAGRTLTVVDRATPVAQIIPYDAEAPLEVRRATRKPVPCACRRGFRSPPTACPSCSRTARRGDCLPRHFAARLVLREPGGLEDLRSSEALVSSELLAVESLRTIDRLRLLGALSPEQAASRRATVEDWLEAVDPVRLQRAILARASEPLPTPLGTLDALHLATALVWRDRIRQTLVMATHHGGLALAARSFGLEVPGA